MRKKLAIVVVVAMTVVAAGPSGVASASDAGSLSKASAYLLGQAELGRGFKSRVNGSPATCAAATVNQVVADHSGQTAYSVWANMTTVTADGAYEIGAFGLCGRRALDVAVPLGAPCQYSRGFDGQGRLWRRSVDQHPSSAWGVRRTPSSLDGSTYDTVDFFDLRWGLANGFWWPVTGRYRDNASGVEGSVVGMLQLSHGGHGGLLSYSGDYCSPGWLGTVNGVLHFD